MLLVLTITHSPAGICLKLVSGRPRRSARCAWFRRKISRSTCRRSRIRNGCWSSTSSTSTQASRSSTSPSSWRSGSRSASLPCLLSLGGLTVRQTKWLTDYRRAPALARGQPVRIAGLEGPPPLHVRARRALSRAAARGSGGPPRHDVGDRVQLCH
jgi:hypothetical protein